MAPKIIKPTGRGFGKQKQIDEEVQRMKEMAKQSLLRRYENGYEAHDIDKHPHGKIFRDPHNPSGIVALPERSIMLLNTCGVVVVFLNNIEDLNRIECAMNLRRVL